MLCLQDRAIFFPLYLGSQVNPPGPIRDDMFLDKFLLLTVQSNSNISFGETIRGYTNFRPFHFTIAAFHLRNVPADFGEDDEPIWGRGRLRARGIPWLGVIWRESF